MDGALTVPPRVQAVPPGAQHIGGVDAVAASQGGGDQRQHLVPRVRPSRRAAEFPQAQVLGEGGRKEQPGIGHQVMVVKEDADTVGFVLWQHLLGAPCFRAVFCSKTIIPDSQEHPLASSKAVPKAVPRWIRAKRARYNSPRARPAGEAPTADTTTVTSDVEELTANRADWSTSAAADAEIAAELKVSRLKAAGVNDATCSPPSRSAAWSDLRRIAPIPAALGLDPEAGEALRAALRRFCQAIKGIGLERPVKRASGQGGTPHGALTGVGDRWFQQGVANHSGGGPGNPSWGSSRPELGVVQLV